MSKKIETPHFQIYPIDKVVKLNLSNSQLPTSKPKQPKPNNFTTWKRKTPKKQQKNSSFAKIDHQGTAFSIPLGVLASNSLLSGPSVSVPKFRRRRAARRSSTGEQRRGKQRMASLKKRSSGVHFLGFLGWNPGGVLKRWRHGLFFHLKDPALQKVDW